MKHRGWWLALIALMLAGCTSLVQGIDLRVGTHADAQVLVDSLACEMTHQDLSVPQALRQCDRLMFGMSRKNEVRR